MKRFVGIILLSALVLLAAQAEPVSKELAKKTAKRFVELYNTAGERTIDDVISYSLENGAVSYHFVTLNPTGWVLVSGDDLLTPVIGYSFEREFVPMIEWEESARVWFDRVDDHIITTLEKPGLPVNNAWDEMFLGSYRKSAAGTAVEPFIQVNWNQGSGWNRFCPEDPDGPGGHAYVGCVAVSMAQAMSVFEYPVQPMGEHGYNHDEYGYISVNYDNAKPYNWGGMSATTSDDENARLLYHLAVGVDMSFGADGSGAYTSKTPGVLKGYFGYSESVKYLLRSSYSDEDWKRMINDELLQGRPLIYSGDGNDGEAGHAFNVDGVGADGTYYHINWGWSGNANGYFTLDALNPGNYNFSYDHAAVVGIKPPSAGPYDITLSNLSVYDQQPVGTFVSAVEIADEFEDNVYTYELKGNFNVLLDDYGPAKFYIENDTLKTSEIFDSEERSTEFLIIEVTDTAGSFFRKEFEITIDKFFFGPTDLTLSDTTVEEGKDPGYFVGSIVLEDDIQNNIYNFSTVGGYEKDNLNDVDCFYVKDDSLFTNKTLYKSEGLVYYMEISVTDGHDHLLKKNIELSIVDNLSGGTSVADNIVDGFNIYPNPVSDFITIDMDRDAASDARIDIYNITGQKCFTCTLQQGNRVDLSELENGIYMVVVRNGDQSSQEKIIISK
ncbi:MAG: thiol protease/hemagglutinin PrtT [Bacteroidales bacterium]|nr:thiol protease/hemagglutinin PrtT [Bacteroidales bacterium]